jgi:hypothetical protein
LIEKSKVAQRAKGDFLKGVFFGGEQNIKKRGVFAAAPQDVGRFSVIYFLYFRYSLRWSCLIMHQF